MTLSNLTEEKIGPCLVALQVEVEQARVDGAMRNAAKRISQQLRIPGFRQGKAPYHVVLRTFGKDAVLNEAVEQLGNEVLTELLEQRGITAYDQPTLEVLKPEPLTLKYTIPTKPVVDLGGYRSLRIQPKAVETIDDDKTNKALEQMRKAHATNTAVERPAQMGDLVRMDLKIDSGDKTILDRKETDVQLQEGEEDISPGFSAAMVGAVAGETRHFELPVPESDTESGLAGQTLHVTATVHEVKEVQLPALDDELARTDGRFETLADLRADLQKNLQENAARRAEQEYEDEVLKAALEGATLEYPDKMVDDEVNHQISHLMSDVAGQGFTFENWLRMNNLSIESLRASIRPNAETRMRNSLFLYAVAEKEGIRIEALDIEGTIEEEANRYPEEMRPMVRDAYSGENARVSLGLNLLQRRTVAKLVSLAKGEGVLLPSDAEQSNRPSEVLVASS